MSNLHLIVLSALLLPFTILLAVCAIVFGLQGNFMLCFLMLFICGFGIHTLQEMQDEYMQKGCIKRD